MRQEYLVYLVLVLNHIAGLIIAIRFFNHVLTARKSNLMIFLVGFIGIGLTVILNTLSDGLLASLILTYMFYFFIAHLFYIGKRHVKAVECGFIVLFSFVTEISTAFLFSTIFGSEIQHVREDLMHLIFGGVVSKLLLMMILEMIIRYRDRNASKVFLGSWLLIISIPVISIFLTATSVYGPIYQNAFNAISGFSCLAILYINMVAFYLFDSIIVQVNENHRYKFREEQILMQQEQYQSIIEGYNQVKRFRHDMLSHLVTLQGYLLQNQVSEAEEYLGKLSGELDLKKSGMISNNIVVDALINNRKTKAAKEGIEFETEIMIPREFIIDDMDLCILLGNALNNAIEACMRLRDNQIEKKISLKMKYKRNCLLIELSNSYDISTVKKSEGQFLSSKSNIEKESHGIGLGNIDAIVEKYGGTFQTNLLDEMFVLKIMIPDADQSSFQV
jgi:hypothetical protein